MTIGMNLAYNYFVNNTLLDAYTKRRKRQEREERSMPNSRYKRLWGKNKPLRHKSRSWGSTDATIYKHYFKSSKPTGRYYVYMLRLNDGTYYVGMTNNVIKRLLQHKNGEGSANVTIRGYGCLVDTWEFMTLEKATEFERMLTEENQRFVRTIGGPYCNINLLERNDRDLLPGL